MTGILGRWSTRSRFHPDLNYFVPTSLTGLVNAGQRAYANFSSVRCIIASRIDIPASSRSKRKTIFIFGTMDRVGSVWQGSRKVQANSIFRIKTCVSIKRSATMSSEQCWRDITSCADDEVKLKQLNKGTVEIANDVSRCTTTPLISSRRRANY